MIVKTPDKRFIDLSSADVICDFDAAFGSGYADACREASRIARKVVGDAAAAKTAILARLRNGWTVIILEPDEQLRESKIETLVMMKLDRNNQHVVDLGNPFEAYPDPTFKVNLEGEVSE